MEKDMDAYVDTEFYGNYDSEDTQRRETSRFRHGYIVMYKMPSQLEISIIDRNMSITHII